MTLLVKNDVQEQERQSPKRKYTIEEFEQLLAEAEHGDRLLELIRSLLLGKWREVSLVDLPAQAYGRSILRQWRY